MKIYISNPVNLNFWTIECSKRADLANESVPKPQSFSSDLDFGWRMIHTAKHRGERGELTFIMLEWLSTLTLRPGHQSLTVTGFSVFFKTQNTYKKNLISVSECDWWR